MVVTSDHGEGLGEHGEETHGYFAYDNTIRVPLLVYAGSQVKPAQTTGVEVGWTCLPVGHRTNDTDPGGCRPF